MGFFDIDNSTSFGVTGLGYRKAELGQSAESCTCGTTHAKARVPEKVFISATLNGTTRNFWASNPMLRSDGYYKYSFSYSKWLWFDAMKHQNIHSNTKVLKISSVSTIFSYQDESPEIGGIKNEKIADGKQRVNTPMTINHLKLNTDLDYLIRDGQDITSAVVSSELDSATYPYTPRGAKETLFYADFSFTCKYIKIPEGSFAFIPENDKDRISLYSKDPERLIAIIEADNQIGVIMGSCTKVGIDGLYLRPKFVFLDEKPIKYHVFLRMAS